MSKVNEQLFAEQLMELCKLHGVKLAHDRAWGVVVYEDEESNLNRSTMLFGLGWVFGPDGVELPEQLESVMAEQIERCCQAYQKGMQAGYRGEKYTDRPYPAATDENRYWQQGLVDGNGLRESYESA